MTIILLSVQYHPDVSKDVDAAESFKSIRHAYEVSNRYSTFLALRKYI